MESDEDGNYEEIDIGSDSEDSSDETRVRVVREDNTATDDSTEEAGTIRRGVDSFDKNLVELLSRFLDTETRSKVYLYLRKR
ncbi:MAG: hypothetical protein SXQ77_13180, partial [Halobacteria archaeon]|nr:hypothetical protein [Halobacteria archaeon]